MDIVLIEVLDMSQKAIGRNMQVMLEQIRKTGDKHVLRNALQNVVDAINKEGVREQLHFLIDILGVTETRKLVEFLTNSDKKVRYMAFQLGNDGPKELVNAVYDECMKENNKVLRSGTKGMLRYLVNKRDIKRVQGMVSKILKT